MILTSDNIKKNLLKLSDKEKAAFFPKFFKTRKGQYGENDKFIGVTVPNQRKVAKDFQNISLSELQKLISSEIHEHRLTGLIFLVNKFKKSKQEESRKELVDFYLNNISYVNNWDLVDSSAEILGAYLEKKDRALIYELARSGKLWHQRIAIIATFHYIKNGEFKDTLAISELLLNHEHDLIHKAVGWMLREIGKRDVDVETTFLNMHYKDMPRTMLRYAIEKFSEEERQYYLRK